LSARNRYDKATMGTSGFLEASHGKTTLNCNSLEKRWTHAFDGYYKFGLCYTTMLHPQIIGKPGNIMLLDRLLSYISRFPNVWFARGDEITRYWMNKKG